MGWTGTAPTVRSLSTLFNNVKRRFTKEGRMASNETHFGKFERNGEERTAYDPAAAVELRFNGWLQTADPTPKAQQQIDAAVSANEDRVDDTTARANQAAKAK